VRRSPALTPSSGPGPAPGWNWPCCRPTTLHGYTSCPKDYSGLARLFFERGYNVYVPREEHHGLLDTGRTGQVSSGELAGYADDALNITAALGTEVGVVGLSGGAVLATWLAERRPDAVAHLLALAPFYQPDSSQAPAFVVKPAIVLWGHRLLPDHRIGDTTFTLSGLAQYLQVARNYRADPRNPKLRSVAVAFSAKDPFIDRLVAARIPRKLATANGLTAAVKEFPPDLNLPHNIAAPANLGSHAQEIQDLYVRLYESGPN